MATGVLIAASAGALAANASARQAAVAFAETAMPTWTQPTNAVAQARPMVAQMFFVDARADQARIRAQMERMEARARADDRLNGRVQPRDGGGRGDWQQQERERMHQERGNGDRGGEWRGSRRG
ncbi:signal peptide protein [Ralstonia sp. AU12-08]|nr:signal peptide protein [Ralstonia sp. AU12-08]